MPNTPESVEWAQRALVGLAQHVEDLVIRRSEASYVIREPPDNDAAHLALGYRDLALKLVVELAEARGVPYEEIPRTLEQWLSAQHPEFT
jgi:hypothetical protein